MLSAEQFAELIALIETTRGEPCERSDVRRAPRAEHSGRITIRLGNAVEAGMEREVELCDISARGIKFAHDELLASGANFVVKLQSLSGDASVSILATVVHCHDVDESRFHIGAEFTCVLSPDPEPVQATAAEDYMRIRSAIID